MIEIKKEHPEGRLEAERLLIKMLGDEGKSWSVYMGIIRALGNLRRIADSMKKEQEILSPEEDNVRSL